MASKIGSQLLIKDGIAVYGYVRENFDKKYCIEEIMAIIIQFYKRNGGSLYVCGSGGNGRLGIEKYKSKTCKKPILCPPFTDNNALKVSVSGYHTLVVDTKGDVWCCGLGNFGQLGTGKTNNLFVPTPLNLHNRVIEVSAGNGHSLLLYANGTVQGCGSNECGQIGLGHLAKILVPTTIETLRKYKIIQISTSGLHSAALTENGILFCFGFNRYGQCGVGKKKEENIMTPTKVDFVDGIEFIECGSNHTLVISRKGLIYSFGSGFHGKLGHGNEERKYVLTVIEALKEEKMTMCGAGNNHSLCIDKEGIIWSFGSNYYGQCGLSEDVEIQETPKMITWFVKNEIKAKECFVGSAQSSVIAHDGSLYLFGCNYDYELGLEEEKDYFTPTKLSISKNMTVQSVSMGVYHTAIICEALR